MSPSEGARATSIPIFFNISLLVYKIIPLFAGNNRASIQYIAMAASYHRDCPIPVDAAVILGLPD